MNIKMIILSIILSLGASLHMDSNAKHISPYIEPQRMTYEWLTWCLQYSPEGIDHPELVYNRMYYTHLVQEHLYRLVIKLPICNELSNYKFNKGFLEIESSILTALIAYSACSIGNVYEANESRCAKYCYIFSAISGLLSTGFLANGIHNINKSYTYEDDIKAKIDRDLHLLQILGVQLTQDTKGRFFTGL